MPGRLKQAPSTITLRLSSLCFMSALMLSGSARGTDAEVLLKQGELIESVAVFSDRSRCVRPSDRILVQRTLTNSRHSVSSPRHGACSVRPGHRFVNGLTAPLLM
jgi:hypothetical protein